MPLADHGLKNITKDLKTVLVSRHQAKSSDEVVASVVNPRLDAPG
eukprot:CAMPEP_0172900218 /NCGR_PEP_ID=MMETSP1075-20121228/163580_1 /TAXON_ID=2916 /ORGANISM="Ceratium fusus, Strain PA161109" /LENGTH=44 /DNA_ID= /DNA_START= /DNA_END= /DNA_ORIENTATION=